MIESGHDGSGKPDLILLINRLVFRRIPHYEVAMRLLDRAIQYHEWAAVRRLIRLLISFMHKGLLKSRAITVEALTQLSKRCGSPMVLRNLGLCHMVDGRIDFSIISSILGRAASARDAVASLVMGMMWSVRAASFAEWEYCYDYFIRAISAGLAEAGVFLSMLFEIAGQDVVALDLMVWAVSRGDCGALYRLIDRVRAGGCRVSSPVPSETFLSHVRGCLRSGQNPYASGLLLVFSGDDDHVADLRVRRMVSLLRSGGRSDSAPVFGEWLASRVKPHESMFSFWLNPVRKEGQFCFTLDQLGL